MFAENKSCSHIAKYSKLLKTATLVCAFSTFQCMSSIACDVAANNKKLKPNNEAMNLCQQDTKTPSRIGKYIQVGASYAFYNKISGNFADKNPNRGLLGQVSLGISNMLKVPVAFEVEGIYYNKNYKMTPTRKLVPTSIDYRIQALAALVNAKYLFQERMSVHPYVGLGLGIGCVTSRTQANYPVPDSPSYIMLKKDYSPAYQAFIGFSKNLNGSFAFNMELRLLSLGKFTDDKNAGRIHQGLVSLGLKYII